MTCGALTFYPSGTAAIVGGNEFTEADLKKSEALGIPRRFDVKRFLMNRAAPWQKSKGKVLLSVAQLHYRHNRWLEQVIWRPDGKKERRYLKYRVTPVDVALETADAQIPFIPYAFGIGVTLDPSGSVESLLTH